MKDETKLKRKIIKRLDEIPDSWWMLVQQRSKRGDPDIVGCVKGRFCAFEIKNELEGKLRSHERLQMYKLTQLAKAYAVVGILTADNWVEQIRLLRKRYA